MHVYFSMYLCLCIYFNILKYHDRDLLNMRSNKYLSSGSSSVLLRKFELWKLVHLASIG
jgi:hypothetical protein